MDGYGNVIKEEEKITIAFLEAFLSMPNSSSDDYINFWTIENYI